MMYEPISKARTSETPGLEDYLKAIRARWWLVALFVIAGLVAATMYTNSRTAMYEASARVLVRPSPVGSTNNQEAPVVLQREKEVVQSNAVAKQVQDTPGIGGSTASLLSDLSVDFEPDSD